jgi:hypothetical protein
VTTDGKTDDYEIDSDLARMDANGVYARVGFVPMPNPEKLMILGHSPRQPLS